MRSAKSGGGAGYAFFEQRMTSGARDQLDLLRDLRRALSDGQLHLVYQPKIHAPSGEITGAEALMRWEHPTRGLVGPDLFIPIAERFGLIGAMGNWLIEEACRQAGEWRDQGLQMRVAINLSAHQLRHPDLADRIDMALRRHDIKPQLLTCEITESVAMEDASNAIRMVERLNQLGVNISIDDFGTGYSSLSYLRKLRAGELKIDKSFVLDLETSADARAVVDGIVKLAQALGLKVVAEGVETEAQHQILRSFGCHELQGFLFARPMSAAGALELGDGRRRPARARVPRFALPRDRGRRPALAATVVRPCGRELSVGFLQSGHEEPALHARRRPAADPEGTHRRSRRRDGHDDPALQARRGRLPRRALQGPREEPEGQRRPAADHPARRRRGDPRGLPARRRRHRRDQHLRRDLGGAGRLRPRRVRARDERRRRAPGARGVRPSSRAPTSRASSPARSGRRRRRRASAPTSTTRRRATSPSPSCATPTASRPRACSKAAATCSWSRRSSTRSTPRRRSSPSTS